jgi:hypothetical protein
MDDGSIQEFDARLTAPLSSVDALLAELRDGGGAHFDAAGWHYLDALARRAAAHEGSVRRMLDAKLEQAVAVFSERLAQARSCASALLDTARTTYPHAAAELQRLFAEGDYKGLRRLCAALDARAQCAALDELVAQLAPASSATGPTHSSLPHPLSRPTGGIPPALELKTVRESRDTWARLSVDKQLALAMKQAPENAGPINSHMLVLRSLAMMQATSPEYLGRIVSYVDTLLALDPGEVAAPVKKKKAAPVKAAKSTKPLKR